MKSMDAVRGTPPSIWPKRQIMAKRTSVRDRERILRLCNQIDKLSWMCEELEKGKGHTIELLEEAWLS